MKRNQIDRTAEAIKAQRNYCEEKSKPFFIPYDGRCYCGADIFDEKGISTEAAGKMLITNCPHCHRSFID